MNVMMINHNEVHLWSAKVHPLTQHIAETYITWLSDSERKRYDRLATSRGRHQFLVTRALVRSALSIYLQVNPEEVEFRYGHYGKPMLDPACGLHFNLSNTNDLVVCLVSCSGPVGVDMEKCTRKEELFEIANGFLSSAEYKELSFLPVNIQKERALSLWTLKEAFVKVLGIGMNCPLDTIRVEFDDQNKISIHVDDKITPHPGQLSYGMFDYQKHRITLVIEGSVLNRLTIIEVQPFMNEPTMYCGLSLQHRIKSEPIQSGKINHKYFHSITNMRQTVEKRILVPINLLQKNKLG